jgi:hypothetical protein
VSWRAFLLLFFIAVVVTTSAVALTVVSQIRDNPDSGIGQPMFPAVAARDNDVAQVSVETPRYNLTFERRGDAWVAISLGDYPTRPEPIAEVLAALANMTTVDAKTDNPAWYDYIGVGYPAGTYENPGNRVIARAADGTVLADAVFGIRSVSMGYSRIGGTFVRPTDEAQAWLVEGQLNVPAFLPDWFAPLFHIPGTDVARVAVTEGGRLVFDATKASFDTGNYQLTYLDPSIGPVRSTTDDNGIRSLTQTIVSTNLEAARPIADVTLPEGSRVIRFTTRDGLVLEATVGEFESQTWVTFRVTAPDGSPAADLARSIADRTANWAFQLPSYRLAVMTRPLTTLIIPPPEPAPQPLGGTPNPGLVPRLLR